MFTWENVQWVTTSKHATWTERGWWHTISQMTELIVRKTKILPGLIDDSLVCGEVLRDNSSVSETVCSEGVPYQEKKWRHLFRVTWRIFGILRLLGGNIKSPHLTKHNNKLQLYQGESFNKLVFLFYVNGSVLLKFDGCRLNSIRKCIPGRMNIFRMILLWATYPYFLTLLLDLKNVF